MLLLLLMVVVSVFILVIAKVSDDVDARAWADEIVESRASFLEEFVSPGRSRETEISVRGGEGVGRDRSGCFKRGVVAEGGGTQARRRHQRYRSGNHEAKLNVKM